VPRLTRHSPFARRAFLALAALAVALKVLLPPGFMVARQGEGFPLVICTSQGNVVVQDDGAPGEPAGKAGHDAPCAFAGNGAVDVPPSLAAPVLLAFAAFEAPEPRALTSLAPGRGLAAPPLPARGPPRFMTI
jgi:hypothetical protein